MTQLIELFKRSVRWRYHLIPLPWSYGREFGEKLAFLEKSINFSDEQLHEYVWEKLHALITFAYENTDYYHELFSKVGCEPGDIKSLADYARLPVTNRKIVRENLEKMTPRGFSSTRPIKTVTSGTSGYPLTLYRSGSQEELRKAIGWRHYREIGYDFKQRRITLGRPLDFPDKQQFFMHDLLENNLQLNTFHLNPRDFELLHRRAIGFRPKMLMGHPAAIYTFALQTEKMGLKPLQVPLIYSISEKLYPHHIEKFSKHFGARIFDYYGNRENTLAVTQFSCGSMHINSEFGLVEFIAGEKHCAVGEVGSIVTTPLENYSTPLLRYDTGDLGRSLGRCDKCERVHPTMEIMGGRGKDVLLTRDGFINCHIDTYLTRHKFTGADYIQVVQKEIDRITLRILPNAEYQRERDEEYLKKLAYECLGRYFEIEIEHLSKPPFTEAGKMPYVVSELAREHKVTTEPWIDD